MTHDHYSLLEPLAQVS